MTEVYGSVDESGKFVPDSPSEFKGAFLEYAGKSVKLVISDVGNNISNNQRRYFFGVVVNEIRKRFIELGTQCTKEQVVDFVKDKFLFTEEYSPITNSIVKSYISLSNSEGAMSKEVFTEKKEEIQRFASEILGIAIADPDPQCKVFDKVKSI